MLCRAYLLTFGFAFGVPFDDSWLSVLNDVKRLKRAARRLRKSVSTRVC